MSDSSRLVSRSLRLPAISMLSCAALCSCGEKKHFSVKSDDGSSVMYGVEKVPLVGLSNDWIFCNGEAATHAVELRFSVGSQELKVPREIIRRIANPSRAGFSVEQPSSSKVKIGAYGENASGTNRLYLEYKDGQLILAEAYTMDADAPEVLFP